MKTLPKWKISHLLTWLELKGSSSGLPVSDILFFLFTLGCALTPSQYIFLKTEHCEWWREGVKRAPNQPSERALLLQGLLTFHILLNHHWLMELLQITTVTTHTKSTGLSYSLSSLLDLHELSLYVFVKSLDQYIS
jgi:hypothetical protein